MAQEGDIVFMIGADVAGLTKGGQQGTKALADLEREAKTLERQLGKIGQAGVDFQRQMNALTGVTKEVAKSARDSAAAFDAFERSRAQVDNLRASIDPLFAASKRYEQALLQLDSALEMGTISVRQHEAMVEQLGNAYLRADGAATTMGKGVAGLGRMSGQTQMLLQMAGYQIQDFAVQVASGTSATRAFAQQFPQMASFMGPWGVAIGTAAAVLVPLVGYFLTGAENADKMSEAMKRQEAVFDQLTEMAKRYRLEREMLASGAATTEEQAGLDAINDLIRQRTSLQAELTLLQYDENYQTSLQLAKQGQVLQAKIKTLDAAIKTKQANVASVAEERKRLEIAQNSKKFADAFKAVQDAIAKGNISGPWQNVLGHIQAAINKAREYQAAAMMYGEVGARGDPRDYGANAGTSNTFDTENFAAPATGGGGGGGGGGGQNPIEAQLEALRQQMMTEEQIEMESFAKRQEMLQQALEQRLLTQQEYAALMEQSQQEHANKMADIDVWRYGTGLDKAEAFFGGMASAMQGGNEKMLAISKKFAAAEALINAWQGFSQVLADKSLPFIAKLPAAMKVLAAGMGAVNAIKGGGGSAAASRGAGATQQAAPQQPVQTMNLHFQNDPWGFKESFARQLSAQINSATRNGMVIQTNVVTG